MRAALAVAVVAWITACGRSDAETSRAAPPASRVGTPRWDRLEAGAIAHAMSYAGALGLEKATPVPAAGDQHALEGWRLGAAAGDLPDVVIELIHTDPPWRQTYRTLAAGARVDASSVIATYVTLTGGRVGVVLAVPQSGGMGYEAMMPTDDAEQFVVVTTVSPVRGAVQGRPPLKWTAALAGAVDGLLFAP
jgi:hypothetical protein